MNRRTALALATMALSGAALAAGDAMAQQRSLKDQLVGAWTLVSNDTTAPNGAKQQLYGATPKGILILDASGRYSVATMKPDRPKFSGNVRPPAAEFGAAALGFAANFGTWSVNEADKTMSRRAEGALNPNTEGTDAKLSVSLAGDELKLVGSSAAGVRTDSVYRRAK